MLYDLTDEELYGNTFEEDCVEAGTHMVQTDSEGYCVVCGCRS